MPVFIQAMSWAGEERIHVCECGDKVSSFPPRQKCHQLSFPRTGIPIPPDFHSPDDEQRVMTKL